MARRDRRRGCRGLIVPRLTAEKWALARAKWEADPVLTDDAIAKEFGVSPQAVHKRRKAGGWVRNHDGLAKLAERAHAKADELSRPQITVTPEQVQREVEAGFVPLNQKVERAVDSKRAEAEDARVAARAQVLERHRSEMNASRKKVYEALQSGDFEKAKLAKITAEALQIIQTSERKAWALDAGEQPGAPGNNTVVVIERVAAPAGRIIDSSTN